MAFIMPILLLAVLAIIDITRVLTIQGILQKAAKDALRMATVVPNFDTPIRGVPPDSRAYVAYQKARQAVIDTALALPLSSLLTDWDEPSSAQLLPFQFIDAGLLLAADEPPPITTSAVGLLRPGECIRIGEGHTAPCSPTACTAQTCLDHPTLASSYGARTINPAIAMKHEPIYIELRAKVDIFTPGLGHYIVRATAAGFREAIPSFEAVERRSEELLEAAEPVPVPVTSTSSTTSTTTSGCSAADYQRCLRGTKSALKLGFPSPLLCPDPTDACRCRICGQSQPPGGPPRP